MTPLQKYINEKHGGSQTAFAKANGYKDTKSVRQLLNAKSPYFVLDGLLVQVKRDIK